jgi:hypothetical protein
MPTVEQTTERARTLVERAKQTWDSEVRPIAFRELGIRLLIRFFVHFFIGLNNYYCTLMNELIFILLLYTFIYCIYITYIYIIYYIYILLYFNMYIHSGK